MLDNNNNGMSVNEISTIRDILVGPQIQELAKRIEVLEKSLQEANGQNNSSHQELQQKIEALTTSVNTDIKQSETNWQTKATELEAQLERQQTQYRADIGKVLIELGNSLINQGS